MTLVGDADGILEVAATATAADVVDLEPRRLAGGDVRQRHADRRALARRAHRRATSSACASATREVVARMLRRDERRAGARRGAVGDAEIGRRRSRSCPSTSATRTRSWRATRTRSSELGPALETHPRFPNRTNVQVAHVDAPGEVTRARLGARRGGDERVGDERRRRRGGDARRRRGRRPLPGRRPAGATRAAAARG